MSEDTAGDIRQDICRCVYERYESVFIEKTSCFMMFNRAEDSYVY